MINNDMMQGSRGQGVDHVQVRRLMTKVMFFFLHFLFVWIFPFNRTHPSVSNSFLSFVITFKLSTKDQWHLGLANCLAH